MKIQISALMIALAWAGAAAASRPVSPPLAVLPATYSQSVTHDQYYTTNYTGAGTITSQYGSASSGGAPYAYASATASGGYSYRSQVSYFFSVSGPPDTAIPLIAYAKMTATATGAAYATVEFNIYGQTQDDFSLSTHALTDPVSRTVSFSGPIHISYNTTNLGGVVLSASAETPYGGTATAFVDPIIMIDPIYALVDPDYLQHVTITLSEGVANAGAPSAAPEPSAWALMILGLGGAGGALRRRRAGSALA